MDVTDVRVRLMKNPADRLKAFCTITFDGEFVVRDVKIVDGTNGLFVAMPSRKLSVPCPSCRHSNPFKARYCNDCGSKVPADNVPNDDETRSRLHRDIAHPITPAFRELLQQKVLDAYEAECGQVHDEIEEQDDSVQDDSVQDDSAEAVSDEVVEEANEEPAEEAIDEPVDESNEYNSLISALRGGHSRSSDTPKESRAAKPPARKTSSRGGRGRRDEGSRPRREETPAPVAAKVVTEDKPVAAKVDEGWSAKKQDEPKNTGFGAGLIDTEDEPKKELKSSASETPKPAESDRQAEQKVESQEPPADNSGGFGAGIL